MAKKPGKKDAGIAKWAKSKRAQTDIEKAFKRSEKTVAALNKARQIDPDTLDRPITM